MELINSNRLAQAFSNTERPLVPAEVGSNTHYSRRGRDGWVCSQPSRFWTPELPKAAALANYLHQSISEL